jgi:hypothetical protein
MINFWSRYVPMDDAFNIKRRNAYYEAQNLPDDMDYDDEYPIPDTPWHNPPISEDHFKMLFHGARSEMQGMHFWSRLFCTTFYALGFLSVFYLAYENILAVWHLTFR